jgi:hypothetical protein
MSLLPAAAIAVGRIHSHDNFVVVVRKCIAERADIFIRAGGVVLEELLPRERPRDAEKRARTNECGTAICEAIVEAVGHFVLFIC